MRKTLMDIYALSKRYDLVETMFYGMDHPSTEAHNILIKAYGKIQQPEKAEEVLQRMLDNPFSAQPQIETINSLLNAWAEAASNPHAPDRAYKIFRWIYDDSRFVKLKLRPNVITYSTLLKCLAVYGYRNPSIRISEQVEATLNELEERYNSGDTTCKPDVQIYTTAIKAFLSVGDVLRAEAMLQRMEKSPEIKPSVRTFSEFLLYHARLGHAEGAQRAEEILDRMRTLSHSSEISFRPNSFTFNIVLNAWATSGSPNAADRMWKVYEKHLADKLELDHVCVNVMTKILSISKRPVDLNRSLQVLRRVNDSKQIQVSNRNYSSVLKGCMTLNDNDTAAHVLTLLIEACTSGRCRLDDPPDRAKFNWIITKWIANDHLVKATSFIEGLLRLTTSRRNTNDLVGIGPDLSTVLELRKAWTASSHPEKADYVAKMDVEIIPAIVRALNIEKGNVQR
jgi:pentatricopeptide repeat protein